MPTSTLKKLLKDKAVVTEDDERRGAGRRAEADRPHGGRDRQAGPRQGSRDHGRLSPRSHAADKGAKPRHVAIVMDGNGRWAKRRFHAAVFGHKAGVDALVRVVRACADRKVEYLTVFAFSSRELEASQRRSFRTDGPGVVAVSKYLARMADGGAHPHHRRPRCRCGQGANAWDHAESVTATHPIRLVSVAFNYGGRWDVVQACRKAIADGVPPRTWTRPWARTWP
jgi:undecaprenyl diphosphate synthase